MTPTDEIEREVGDALDTFCDSRADEHWHVSSRALDDLTVWFAAYIAKREEGLREANKLQADRILTLTVEVRDFQTRLSATIAERDALREQLAGARARALLVFVALGGDQGESESLDAAVSRIVAERDALRAQLAERDRELELLREVERTARDFVLAHDSIVVRFQDATLAQVYEDRARRLDTLLDHYDKGDGP